MSGRSTRSRLLPVVTAITALLMVSTPVSAKTDGESPIGSIAVGDAEVWAWTTTYELVRVDAAGLRVTHRVGTLPGALLDLAVGEGGVWGAGPCGRPRCDYGVLMRFDPATGQRSRPLTRLGLNPRAVATGYGSVWVLGARRVLRIDPTTRRMVGRPIDVGRGARDIAVGEGAIWVTTGKRRGSTGAATCDLVGIDPRSNRVIRRQRIGCPAAALAFGSGSVWAASSSGRGIARVRPRGARLPLPGVQLPGESIDVAAGLGAIWVAGVRNIRAGRYGVRSGQAVLSRLDGAGRRAGPALRLGPARTWMPRVVAGAGAVWVANTPTGTITRIDPDSGAVSRLRVAVRR